MQSLLGGDRHEKIEAKARIVLSEEMRRNLEKGRVKKVVPEDNDEAARKSLELEKGGFERWGREG